MEWTIEYIVSEALLYVKTKGKLTKESANAMATEIVDAMEKHACQKQIVDHTDTEIKLTVVQFYERPEINEQIGMSHKWRIGVVFKELDENTYFMETVFRNRGFNLRQFDSLEKAKQWILGE